MTSPTRTLTDILSLMGDRISDAELGVPEGTLALAARHLDQTVTDEQYRGMSDDQWIAACEAALLAVQA